MNLCVVTFKECWEDAESGQWVSTGGFPHQMAGVASLFDGVTLVVTRGSPTEGGIPLPSGARVIALRPPIGDDARRKLSVMARLPYYLGIIVREVRRADVVHTPLPGDLSLLGFWTALAFRKRLIARFAGSWVPNAQATMMGRLTRKCMRWFAGGRNVMFASGQGSTPPASGIEWLLNTVLTEAELDSIAESAAAADAPRESPAHLVYIGRLSPEKGVHVLIRAMAALNGRVPCSPMLTIIGDGSERAALESMTRELNCEHAVRFRGQLDRTGLALELRNADLCVQPSLTEGSSKAWLDAMAYGVPVLASEVGAAAAIVGEGGRGWVVPPDDVGALADQIVRILIGPDDWPARRRRCRTYTRSLTLEGWTNRIGETCARQWQMRLVDGKLRP
jgi:glycosyltransferase involved in cell wall biosynthesis